MSSSDRAACLFQSQTPKDCKIIHPKHVKAAKSVVAALTRLPAFCLAEAVAEAVPVPAINSVIVKTFGAMVVPGTVVAGFVVAGTTVLPLTMLAETV